MTSDFWRSATKLEIKRRIYLSGLKPDYEVHHHMPGEEIVCYVSSVDIGNTIVRALRERALKARKAKARQYLGIMPGGYS